jgi:hypothetical protein
MEGLDDEQSQMRDMAIEIKMKQKYRKRDEDNT